MVHKQKMYDKMAVFTSKIAYRRHTDTDDNNNKREKIDSDVKLRCELMQKTVSLYCTAALLMKKQTLWT